ncbi:Rhodanese-like domain [Pseudocohnilembus persalinus]|uniref:Rhodanese-like domain n=1 Tax=Pseudocohnilembus persalinus TaxID=266149 RepID=A0A0V0QPE9_PSEPJ|nr:Rhodanese-like domain [Pseudocohnilembus persalinus]|eukprot:KRX03962.1 Rhodanese-like domain [Pseudocohnilembus persalinus]
MSIITDSQISTKNKISYYFCHIFDPETQVYSYYLEYKNEAIIIDPIFSFFQEYTQIFEKRKSKLAYVGITHLSARVIWGYQYFFSNYFQYKKQNLTLILGENYKYAETSLPSIAKFERIIANKRIQQIVLGEDINVYFISTPSVTDCSMVFWTNEFIFTGALLGFEKSGIICPYNYEKILDTEYNFYAKQFTTSLQRIFNLNPDLIIYPSIHMGNKQYVNLWEIQQMIDFKNEQESLESFQNELINQWNKQNQNLQQYKRDILIKNTYNDPYQLAYESGEIDEKYISDYLNEKQNQQTIVLLDTRDRQLFMKNHLKNSINICPELSITRMVPLLFDSTSFFILIDEDIKKCQNISDKLNNIGLFNRVGYFTTKGKILENFVFNNIKMNKELEIPEIELAIMKPSLQTSQRYKIEFRFNNFNQETNQLIGIGENQINPFGKAQFHCKFTKMVKPKEIAFGVFHKQEIEHENNSFGKNWKQSIEDNQLQYIVFANDDNNQRKYGNQQFTGISIDPNFTHHNLITVKNTLEVKQVNLYNGEQTASFKKIKCGKCKKDLHLIEENPYNEMSIEQTTGFNCCKCQQEGKIFEKFYHCDCEIVKNRIKSGKEAKQTCFDICVDCYDQGLNESQNKQKNKFLCQLCSSTLLEQQQIYIDDEWECDICGEQIDKMGFDCSYQCQQQCKIQQFNVCKECYKQEDNRCISFLQPSLRNVINMRYILQIKVEKLNKKGFLGIGACIFSKVKSKNFTLDTEIEDHGVYLINNDGIVYSCLEKHLNGKKIPITKNSLEKINNDKQQYFTYKNGDIIKINLMFEKRILEFQNCNTGLQFQLMIDVNYENEIFPCIMLMSHEDVIHCIQGKELRNFEQNNQIEIKKIENLTSWEFKQYYQLQQFSDAQEIVDIQKIYNDQLENLKDQQLSVSFYQQKQKQSQKIDLSQSLEFNQSFRQFIKNENMIVVDVRLENEYRFGSLPGAIKCPLNNLPQLGEKLADKKDKQIFIFSLQGYISVLAISILAYLGFEKLVNIYDGFIGLQQQGFQDVKEIYISGDEDYNITDDESDKFKLTDQQIEEQKKQNELAKEKSNIELTEIDKKQSFQNWRDRMPKNNENDDIPEFYIPKSEKRQRQRESQSNIINNQTEQNSNEQFTKNENENKNIDNSEQETQNIQNNVIKLKQNSENLQKIQRNLQYSELLKQNEYQTPQKNIQNINDKKSQNFQDENQYSQQNNVQKYDNNTYNQNNQQKSEYKGSIIDQQPLVQSVFKKDSQLFQDLNFVYKDIENQNRIDKDQKHNYKSLRSSLLNTNKKSGVQKKVNFDIQEYQNNIQEEEN